MREGIRLVVRVIYSLIKNPLFLMCRVFIEHFQGFVKSPQGMLLTERRRGGYNGSCRGRATRRGRVFEKWRNELGKGQIPRVVEVLGCVQDEGATTGETGEDKRVRGWGGREKRRA
jgi:hypothetical protein